MWDCKLSDACSYEEMGRMEWSCQRVFTNHLMADGDIHLGVKCTLRYVYPRIHTDCVLSSCQGGEHSKETVFHSYQSVSELTNRNRSAPFKKYQPPGLSEILCLSGQCSSTCAYAFYIVISIFLVFPLFLVGWTKRMKGATDGNGRPTAASAIKVHRLFCFFLLDLFR